MINNFMNFQRSIRDGLALFIYLLGCDSIKWSLFDFVLLIYLIKDDAAHRYVLPNKESKKGFLSEAGFSVPDVSLLWNPCRLVTSSRVTVFLLGLSARFQHSAPRQKGNIIKCEPDGSVYWHPSAAAKHSGICPINGVFAIYWRASSYTHLIWSRGPKIIMRRAWVRHYGLWEHVATATC